MYEMEQIDERVILVGIDTGNEDAANRSLDEPFGIGENCKSGCSRQADPAKRERASGNIYRERQIDGTQRSYMGD